MMIRRLAFLMLAVVISGATIFGARVWLQAQLANRETPVVVEPVLKPSTNVLVAKTDLPAGSFVRPENLRWQSWPEDGVAETYAIEGKRPLEDFVGAVVRSGLTAGEPIVDGRVVRPGERGFMAAVLTPGSRAVTVSVTPSSGIAGFVFPGDRVDVILTLTIPEEDKPGHERRASETVLTDLRVLAVDQRADDQKKEVAIAKTATLEATPKQAEIIALVSEMGRLSLSLRSLAMDAVAEGGEERSRTWDNEASTLLSPVATGKGSPVHKVSVIRGSVAADVEFKGGRK